MNKLALIFQNKTGFDLQLEVEDNSAVSGLTNDQTFQVKNNSATSLSELSLADADNGMPRFSYTPVEQSVTYPGRFRISINYDSGKDSYDCEVMGINSLVVMGNVFTIRSLALTAFRFEPDLSGPDSMSDG